MRRVLVAAGLVLLFVISSYSSTVDSLNSSQVSTADGRDSNVVIAELFVSPNNLVANDTSDNVYGAVDWNGDGDYGKFSDQFIEIWNSGDTAQDVSSWLLSTTSGSPPCQLPYNTTLNAGERIVVFRADSDLDLSYFDGETVTISDTDMNPVNSMSFPAGDSSYGRSYISDDGTISKDDPTPGRPADFSEPYTVPDNIVNCYKLSNTDSSRAFLLKGRVVTMDGESNVINDGNVMIRDGKITGVWPSSSNPPAGVDFTDVPIVETEGTIYPGLIDLHNHVHYNHIPLWDFDVHLSESQKSEEGGYTNRYQWGNNWDYGPSITWMKTNIQSTYRWDMASEQMKYAEVQAVSGGVTAMQGSPSSGTQAWDSILSRNVELYNFGQDGISTCAVCGAADDDYTGSHLISQSEAGTLNAWFVHLSEGVDQPSKDEFDALWNKGLIMDETIVIHGTALDSSQFSKMASVNSELVWSPLSNLLLYGDTTDVVAAHQAGVSISISPDWGPSGSKNNLHELKVADMWNTNNLGGHFSNYELVEMVTSNPADATGWAPFVGRIKADLYADLVVIDTFHEDPYRNLIEAIDADVALTVVQGKAVFGDVDIMQQLQGDDWEYVNGKDFQKAVDVTSLTEVDGSQTFAEIEAGLAMAMRHEFDDMKNNWVEFNGDTDDEINAWLNTTFDGDYRDEVNRLKNMTLDPIFTTGDDRYFDVINRSGHANFHIDLSKLYDDYYTVEMVNGDRININIQLPEDNVNTGNNNGGTDDNNNAGDTTTLPGPVDNNTVDDEDDMFADLPDDQFIDESEASQETKNQLKLILGLIVIILLFGLYVVSRTDDSDELLNSQNSVVEKIWDDDEINETKESLAVENEETTTDTNIDIKDKVASAMKSSGLSAVRLFTAIDQTDDGYVSRREIRTAVNTLLKDSVNISDIDAMLETFDANGDGVISLDEFLSVMEQHQPKQFVPVLPDLKPPPK
ncbi:MAG: amidohydrolase family protein [Candidatus Thermoplasmatota archaeon]|nr:amidohydrolase family protein [Candidatus Thermoplasmatota archaeon]